MDVSSEKFIDDLSNCGLSSTKKHFSINKSVEIISSADELSNEKNFTLIFKEKDLE